MRQIKLMPALQKEEFAFRSGVLVGIGICLLALIVMVAVIVTFGGPVDMTMTFKCEAGLLEKMLVTAAYLIIRPGSPTTLAKSDLEVSDWLGRKS